MHLTPDSLKALFDGNAMLVQFIVGLLYTRLPALKNLSNAAVPWINAVLYVVGTYVLPGVAHASVGGDVSHAAGFMWRVAMGAWTSALTSLLYDKFLKAPIDAKLPVPVPTK